MYAVAVGSVCVSIGLPVVYGVVDAGVKKC